MAVVSMVVGATTSGGATFVAKVGGGGPVRVAVATDAAMTSPVFTTSQAVDAQGVAKVSIAGLAPSTRFWWQVEDNAVLDTSVTGQFVTHPVVGSQASFTIALASCAGAGTSFPGSGTELVPANISNHPVFDTIRQQALAGDWLMFVHMGDLHYYNLGDTLGGFPDSTLANYRTSYDDVLAQSNQAGLYREVATGYVWDDHDFGPNDSDGTHPDKANAATAYRERWPHYPLTDPDGIWQAPDPIGRVQFVLSDTRYYRSPNADPDGPSKTMLGTAQKTFLEGVLSSTSAEVLVWVMPSQWIADGDDTWGNFATERDELAAMLAEHGWLGRTVMVYGDRHAAGIDSGSSNLWGGFPVLQAASLDSNFGDPVDGRFDILDDTPGRDQYGTVAINDLGSAISITLTAWNGTSALGTYSFGIALTPTPSVTVEDMANLITGSHTATFEARVLTTFQTGDLPVGQTIPILGGDVTYDATADTFGSLTLTTGGVDELGVSRFPRLAGDLLAPYGNEVFVRRGVAVSPNSTVWVPLGYYPLNEDDQNTDSDHPITLQARDRMSRIVDARLVRPRKYGRTRTISSVVDDLVRDVYPLAVIAFDDDSGSQQLGRSMLVDEDRYGALRDVANSLGKVMFFDGEGILRIQDPPDPQVVSWELNAGSQGVLFDVSRRVSREDMYNAVVVRGEGGDTTTPVQAVVVDIGPNSPTSWFPPDDPSQLWFGQKPRFYSSPLLTDSDQARAAGRSLLRRYIGMPYEIGFGVVPNPALRPYDVVRITHKDGNRDVHITDSVTVPLVYSAAMTGTTREQTRLLVGDL